MSPNAHERPAAEQFKKTAYMFVIKMLQVCLVKFCGRRIPSVLNLFSPNYLINYHIRIFLDTNQGSKDGRYLLLCRPAAIIL